MKRTPLIAITILCIALVGCASTGTDPVDRNASNHQPGNPQATEPEEMHGHSHNATGVSTAETSVKGGSATVIAGNAMESPTRGTDTTIVTTPGVAQVDATLVPNTSSTSVSGTSGTSTTTMTDNTATLSGSGTVSGNTSASTSSSTLNDRSTTITTTTTTTSGTSGNMTSSTTTDDDDDETTATESRRRMRKD